MIAVLLVCMVPLGACRKNVSTNPAVVQAVVLTDAENTCKLIDDGLKSANAAIEKLQVSEPGYYAHVKPLIRKISAANATASSKVALVAAGGSADWRGALIAVGTSVTPSDLTTFGFKNSNTQLIVEAAFGGLIATLNSIPSKFGVAK